ncbi:MAG TPA: RNA polymerase sigma factor [Caulobacteraceae bacterium]|nr:RNA polymerase sigma factor [Caulobacteraceae bacterium]
MGAQQGKGQSSVEALDLRYRRPLVAFFRRRTPTTAEAEDLAQEVFVRLLQSKTFRRGAGSDAFVFTVASNLLRDRARMAGHRKQGAHFSVDGADGFAAGTHLIEDRSPERVLIGREALAIANTALLELPIRTREIFVLCRYEQLSHREIAKFYGVTVSAVEKHVAKALAHLASRLKGA